METVCVAHPLVAVCTEEARVVALLYDDVGDPRLVFLLQTDARLPDSQQLIVKHLIHTDTQSVFIYAFKLSLYFSLSRRISGQRQ